MLEAIFKQQLKKWETAIKVLDENLDNLSESEINAISTLKNLWRKAKFGPDCKSSVENMVQILIDGDKGHSNNHDIIQASKDFRGAAKVFYTTDEETFKMFADDQHKKLGGPLMSDEQRQRRQGSQSGDAERRRAESERRRREAEEQRRAEERQRTEAEQAEETRQRLAELRNSLRPYYNESYLNSLNIDSLTNLWVDTMARLAAERDRREAEAEEERRRQEEARRRLAEQRRKEEEARRKRQEEERRQRERQRQEAEERRIGEKERQENNGRRMAVITLSLIVIAIVCFTVWSTWKSNTTVEVDSRDYSTFLLGDWNGEADNSSTQIEHRMPATLKINSVEGDSVQGIIYVKNRRKLETHELKGYINRMEGGSRLMLHFEDNNKGSVLNSFDLLINPNNNIISGVNSYDYRYDSHTTIDSIDTSLIDVVLYKAGAEISDSTYSAGMSGDVVTGFTTDPMHRFYNSMAPVWLIVGLLIFIFFIPVLTKFSAGLLSMVNTYVMPVCLALILAIELGDYCTLERGMFWWCNSDQYGFWGSLWRVALFMIMLGIQVTSMIIYENTFKKNGYYKYLTEYGKVGVKAKGKYDVESLNFAISVIFAMILFGIMFLIGVKWLNFTSNLSLIIIFGLPGIIVLAGIYSTFKDNIGNLGFGIGVKTSLMSVVNGISVGFIFGLLLAALFTQPWQVILTFLVFLGMACLVILIYTETKP